MPFGFPGTNNAGGFRAILTDQNKLIVAVGGVTALAAGVYTTRFSFAFRDFIPHSASIYALYFLTRSIHCSLNLNATTT